MFAGARGGRKALSPGTPRRVARASSFPPSQRVETAPHPGSRRGDQATEIRRSEAYLYLREDDRRLPMLCYAGRLQVRLPKSPEPQPRLPCSRDETWVPKETKQDNRARCWLRRDYAKIEHGHFLKFVPETASQKAGPHSPPRLLGGKPPPQQPPPSPFLPEPVRRLQPRQLQLLPKRVW